MQDFAHCENILLVYTEPTDIKVHSLFAITRLTAHCVWVLSSDLLIYMEKETGDA